jgi:type VI secretion system protein ImpB
MSSREPYQHKLDRVRKPRVHITYDVEIGDAVVVKELPFVVGVMGDFTGNSTQALKPLQDRKFVSIDRDNFNDVMAQLSPGLNLKVPNTLKGDGSEMSVQLNFGSMEDFEPARIVEQVEPLKILLEARNKLRDLLSATDRSPKLESELERILQNTEEQKKLAGELGSSGAASTGGKPSAGGRS